MMAVVMIRMEMGGVMNLALHQVHMSQQHLQMLAAALIMFFLASASLSDMPLQFRRQVPCPKRANLLLRRVSDLDQSHQIRGHIRSGGLILMIVCLVMASFAFVRVQHSL
jgi:hypothetical protein